MGGRRARPAFLTGIPVQTSMFCDRVRPCCDASAFTQLRIGKSRLAIAPIFRRSGLRCNTNLGDSTVSTSSRTSNLVWAVGRSTQYKVVDAVREAVTRAASTLGRKGVEADLVLIFVKSRSENTPDDEVRRVIPVLRKTLAMTRLMNEQTKIFGCTAASYLEDDDPSVNVVLAHFPEGTTIQPFVIPSTSAFDLDWKQDQWQELVGFEPRKLKVEKSREEANDEHDKDAIPNFYIFLLQHPDFEGMLDLLSGLDFAYPGVRKFGGLAGRAHPLHTAYLFDSDGLHTDGVLGIAVASSSLQIDVTVAQGARGVGPMMEVTGVRDGNEICKVKEIGTPTEAEAAPMTLLDMWSKTDFISQDDRMYASRYLLFGVEVQKVADMAVSSILSEKKEKEEEGNNSNESNASDAIDMVIRKVVAFNEATNSLAVEGGDVRLGSRVQFQIRDEEAARSELALLLDKLTLEGSSKAMEGMSLMGAILIVDSERGANLYGKATPDLDLALYAERFPVPLAMLVSEGQIGPLPAGGLLGAAGNTFTLSASALYLSVYGPSQPMQSSNTPELEE